MDNTEQTTTQTTTQAAPLQSTTQTPVTHQKQEEKTHFSLEYVQELRAESAKYRTSAKEAVKAAEDAKAESEKIKAESEQKVAQAITAADQRIIRAELKAEAIKAGMVDLDGLKLADLSQLKLDEKGEVVGAGDLMKSLKEAKPYLFSAPADTTTTTGHKPPPKEEAKPFDARTATQEEIAAKAREMGIGIKTH